MNVIDYLKNGSLSKIVDDMKKINGFNPKAAYHRDDMPVCDIIHPNHQKIELGKIVHLMEKMTENGATAEEIGRVVRYSMVVIDALKHKLDWKQAKKDFNIAGMMDKYMRGGNKNG